MYEEENSSFQINSGEQSILKRYPLERQVSRSLNKKLAEIASRREIQINSTREQTQSSSLRKMKNYIWSKCKTKRWSRMTSERRCATRLGGWADFAQSRPPCANDPVLQKWVGRPHQSLPLRIHLRAVRCFVAPWRLSLRRKEKMGSSPFAITMYQ